MSEKLLLMLEWDGAVFRPRARLDMTLAAKFRQGSPLEATIKERRSEPRNRLYWAVLQAICDATGKWPNSEALHWALKIRLGYIEEIASVDGEILIRPRSTSFAKMSEQEFREYFDAAMSTLLTDVVPGLTIEDLLALGKTRLTPAGRAA